MYDLLQLMYHLIRENFVVKFEYYGACMYTTQAFIEDSFILETIQLLTQTYISPIFSLGIDSVDYP